MNQSYQEIYNKIVKILSDQMNIESDVLSPESSLEIIGVDSLDRVEIVMKIEDEFNIKVDDNKAMQIATVSELINYIQTLVNK